MADDTQVYLAWGISALVLIVGAAFAGKATGRGFKGLLISAGSGRISLTNLQLTLWTIVILSLLSGFFFARLFGGVNDALGFDIPSDLLVVMGISVSSTVVSTGIAKSPATPGRSAVSASGAKVSQALTSTSGAGDDTVDIARFQNFWFTFFAVVAYIGLAIAFISGRTLDQLSSLPNFNQSLNVLLGISHVGYLARKSFTG
jgi:hypothetical protein